MKAVHIRSIDAAGIYSPLPSSVVAPPIDRPREGDRDRWQRRRRRSLIRRTVGVAVLSPGPTNVSLLRFTSLSALSRSLSLSLTLSLSLSLSLSLFQCVFLCFCFSARICVSLSLFTYLVQTPSFYHFSP